MTNRQTSAVVSGGRARRAHLSRAARAGVRAGVLAGALGLLACSGTDPLFQDGGALDVGLPQDGPLCLPDNDGVIQRSEVSFVPGLAAQYRVNEPGTVVGVDVEGQAVDGVRQWDFSSTSGVLLTVTVQPVADQWFAEHFPSASFAMAADASGEILQLFQMDGDRVLLLGLASRAPDRTLMVYDEPVLSLRFPMRVGDSFVAHGVVLDGKLDGLPVATRDTYTVQVDASGTVRLPFVKLHKSLRVRVTVESTLLGGATVTNRQVQWFHECYGEVVRAVSKPDEQTESFTQAVELRRLSF